MGVQSPSTPPLAAVNLSHEGECIMEKRALKQRMREDLQLRGFSPHTQKEYLMRVTLFARYFGRLPDKLGEKEVKEYFLHLVRDKHASYGVLNMTYCCLCRGLFRFLNRRLPWASAQQSLPFYERAEDVATGLMPSLGYRFVPLISLTSLHPET
jgi:hypothetical protein